MTVEEQKTLAEWNQLSEEKKNRLIEAGWRSPEQMAVIRHGWEVYSKYADGYVTFQKIRTGQLELTEEEKRIIPAIQAAKKLLGIL